MKADRNIQILTTGLKAACERMFSDKGLRRPEYPRNLQRIYSYMEDEVFELFTSVQDKRYTLVRENAADIIVTASKMIEYAELLAEAADKAWDAED
jgi:NTP pyrophosphatase (non-canonical NTP hydrolase)